MANSVNKFPPKADQPPAEKPIIMIVDDEPQIGGILTRFLAKHNYEALFFTSAKDALAYLSRPARRDAGLPAGLEINTAVGLLLTDMAMPDHTGLELARQVKTLYPKLPIIVMSGSADGQDRDEIFKLCADFIPKPFNLFELLERINFHLPRPDGVGTGRDKQIFKRAVRTPTK